MANEPAKGSFIICGVRPAKDSNQEYVPLRISVDDSYDPPRVLVHALGTFNQGLPSSYTEAYESSSNRVVYHGFASPGTAKSAAGWAIRKFIYSGFDVTDVQWAGGTAAFNSVWDNRASYTYS